MFGTINKLGVLSTVATTTMNLGCRAGVLGPLAAVFFAGGLLGQVPITWRLPLLYVSLAVTLVSFSAGWRRHRQLAPLLLFLAGAAAVLYPFHDALDVAVLEVFVWLGLGLALAGAAYDAWLSFRARRCRLTLSRSEVSQ